MTPDFTQHHLGLAHHSWATDPISRKYPCNNIQKSHTCEEGRENLRISCWHLLMNLKNNHLLNVNTYSVAFF